MEDDEMRSKQSKLLPVLRAMDAYTAPAQPEPQCAIMGCDEWPVTTCVCCNRDVCAGDVAGATADDPGLCMDCLIGCAGGMACKVVMK